jgi:hypothetical protein
MLYSQSVRIRTERVKHQSFEPDSNAKDERVKHQAKH